MRKRVERRVFGWGWKKEKKRERNREKESNKSTKRGVGSEHSFLPWLFPRCKWECSHWFYASFHLTLFTLPFSSLPPLPLCFLSLSRFDWFPFLSPSGTAYTQIHNTQFMNESSNELDTITISNNNNSFLVNWFKVSILFWVLKESKRERKREDKMSCFCFPSQSRSLAFPVALVWQLTNRCFHTFALFPIITNPIPGHPMVWIHGRPMVPIPGDRIFWNPDHPMELKS